MIRGCAIPEIWCATFGEMGQPTEGQINEQTDGRMDGQTDGLK